jgi:hypothetical protein
MSSTLNLTTRHGLVTRAYVHKWIIRDSEFLDGLKSSFLAHINLLLAEILHCTQLHSTADTVINSKDITLYNGDDRNTFLEGRKVQHGGKVKIPKKN